MLFFGSPSLRIEIYLDEIESATLETSSVIRRSPNLIIITLLNKQEFKFKFQNDKLAPESSSNIQDDPMQT